VGSLVVVLSFDLGVLMKKTRTTLSQIAGIAMLSVVAMALSSATVGAAVDLSQSDLSNIANAVDGAIASAKAGLPAGATEAQVNAAVAAAISSETQTLITQYGTANPMLVAEAIITAAVQDGASPRAIGDGMATAALAEGSTIGLEIADAVGGTGTRGMVEAFKRTADESGTNLGTVLASAADTYENVAAGGNGGNGSSHSFFGGNGGGGGGNNSGGGCRNPSCT
jgi:hypothetical protein